ncbi:MAG: hypothetical protein ACKVOB_00115 [Sphingomonas sp.]
MKRTIVAAFVVVTAFGGTASAQAIDPAAPPAHGADNAAPADVNGDGLMSRAAFLAQAAIRFDRMDTNKDGVLSGDERRHDKRSGNGDTARINRVGLRDGGANGAAGGNRGAAMFARLDVDRDGKLSRDEISRMSAARFDGFDTNRDGYLAPDELRAGAGRGGLRGRGPGRDQGTPPADNDARPPR